MMITFTSLKDLDSQNDTKLEHLPRIWSPFCIPKLVDKPQDPIISTIENRRKPQPSALPDELILIAGQLLSKSTEEPEMSVSARMSQGLDIATYKNRLLSWDTFENTCLISSTPSPYLTEQSPRILSAARHRVLPRYLQPHERLVYFSTDELLDCFVSTLAGDSSPIHSWNPSIEQFEASTDREGIVLVLVDGMDEVVSDSYINQFIEMGTMIRRLDNLVLQLQRRQRNIIPTTTAFAHGLSLVLLWVQRGISDALYRIRLSGAGRICDIWASLHKFDEITKALGCLCHRSLNFEPSSYPSLPESQHGLLSHTYAELSTNMDRSAPTAVCAVISYILTVTSRPYFKGLGESIGLERFDKLLEDARLKARIRTDETEFALSAGDDDDFEGYLDNTVDQFPSFVPRDLVEAVHRARRSIKILSSPEVDDGHPIELQKFKKLEWVWTEEDIAKIANPLQPEDVGATSASPPNSSSGGGDRASVQRYARELSRFAVFDKEPGSSVSYGPASSATSSGLLELDSFINRYPPRPPSCAATLPLLSERILTPLAAQTSALGRAALRVFLTHNTPLHFRTHLLLLRAYLLLAAPAFKARLSAALFSDAIAEDEDVEENPMGITIRTRERNTNWRAVRVRTDPLEMRSERVRSQPWAVGIFSGLLNRSQWPPGGSDLAFYLRRVIMDSLDDVRATENMFARGGSDEFGDDEFWNGCESRIGFAIRDLPVGKGRDRWMDPTLIEALDFLYMDYKPPRPLRSLITSDIIIKYRRVFAFLLRLLRVEHASRVLYRLTRPSANSIFHDNPITRNIINHFRFSAESFITALSAYTADTAIRGNLDAFDARIKITESEITAHVDQEATAVSIVKGDFTDVYSVMKRHARVLDDVLAACLLRGTQQAVAQLLHNCLEIILEFAAIVGNVHKGMVQEPAAAERLDTLYRDYRRKIAQLIKTLRKICMQDSRGFAMGNSEREKGLPSAPGGQEALSDLLVRLSGVGFGGRS